MSSVLKNELRCFQWHFCRRQWLYVRPPSGRVVFVSTTKAQRARVSAVRELRLQPVNTTPPGVLHASARASGQGPVDVAETQKVNDTVASCSLVIIGSGWRCLSTLLPSWFSALPGRPSWPSLTPASIRGTSQLSSPSCLLGRFPFRKEMLYIQHFKNC